MDAHSTGGLITTMWIARHPGVDGGLVLNSPWMDLQGSAMMRAIGGPLVETLATRRSSGPSRRRGDYARTLHRWPEGEWDYDRP